MEYRIKKVHDIYTVEEKVIKTYLFKKGEYVWVKVNVSMFAIEGKLYSHPFKDIKNAYALIELLIDNHKRKHQEPEYIYT